MNSTGWYRIVACALLATIVSGCPERTITLFTTPSGAKVTKSSDQGLRNFYIGETDEAGLTHVLKFGSDGPSMYNVNFQFEGYEPTTIAIRKNDEQYDAENVTMEKTDDLTEFHVKLRREVVREVERLEAKITEKGYTIEPRIVRAWVEDIEREAMGASNILKLADLQSISGMSISADGNILVFSMVETIKDTSNKEKIVASLRSIQTKRGGGMTQVTSGQWRDLSPVISSDSYVYFYSDRLRKDGADIFRISLEKSGAITVILQTPEGTNYDPSIVENNKIMAYTYKPTYVGGIDQIWTLGGENQYRTQLREGSMPTLSPDGTQIAYIGPDKQLWKVPVDGQNPVQLTNTPIQKEGKRNPVWSPDGKYIVYASDVAKDSTDIANYDIWMIRNDGTSPQQLTTNGSNDVFPVVSPDQKYIYFVSNRGFKEGIWRIPFPVSD